MASTGSQSMDFNGLEVECKELNIGPSSTVTQTTNRSTGVTINATAGQITTDTTSLAAGAEATFVVTNSYCGAKTVPMIAIASGAAATPIAFISAVASGQFSITISNLHATTGETGALVINFVLINAV